MIYTVLLIGAGFLYLCLMLSGTRFTSRIYKEGYFKILEEINSQDMQTDEEEEEDDEGNDGSSKSDDGRRDAAYISSKLDEYDWQEVNKVIARAKALAKECKEQVLLAAEFRNRCYKIAKFNQELLDEEEMCRLEDQFLQRFLKFRARALTYDDGVLGEAFTPLKSAVSDMKNYVSNLAYKIETETKPPEPKHYTRSEKQHIKDKEREVMMKTYAVPDDTQVESLPKIMENLTFAVEVANTELDPESIILGIDIINLYSLWKGIMDENLTDAYVNTGSVIVGLARNFFELYRDEVKYKTNSDVTYVNNSICKTERDDVREQFKESEKVIAKLAEIYSMKKNLGHNDEKQDAETWNMVLGSQLRMETEGELLSSSGTT